MGETELVLDTMTVDDVLRVLGAVRRPSSPAATDSAPVQRESTPADDWRTTLKTAAVPPATPPTTAPATPRVPPMAPPTIASAGASAGAPTTGLVFGSSERELFAGPFAHLATLEEIATAVARCQRCVLHATALKPVPGEGNPRAELVCVGEAPGATEDQTGRPFVGQAGQLLTKILGAINLRREDVFICNVLKHRPPANRNPRPEEVEACSPYVVRQLEIIRPSAVLALGTFAAQTLLNTKLSIGKLRGAIHHFYGVPLVVTYHPAALLRNPAWKRPTWEDVQLVRRILDRPARSP